MTFVVELRTLQRLTGVRLLTIRPSTAPHFRVKSSDVRRSITFRDVKVKVDLHVVSPLIPRIHFSKVSKNCGLFSEVISFLSIRRKNKDVKSTRFTIILLFVFLKTCYIKRYHTRKAILQMPFRDFRETGSWSGH